MNSESIKLLKEAVYYIKKAEFEKQGAIKGKDIGKAWEGVQRAGKAIGEGARRGWNWLKSLGTKQPAATPPEYSYDTVVPKNSLLDKTVETATNYSGDLALADSLFKKDELSPYFTPKFAPTRLFSENLNPTALIDPLPDMDFELNPFWVRGPIQGLAGQRDINIGLKNKVHPKVRHQYARRYFQARVKTPEQRAEFHKLVSPDRSISPAAISQLEQRARWADMLQYLAQNSGKGKNGEKSRELFFKTLRLNPATRDNGSAYKPISHSISVQKPYSPMVLGHELGHALYDSRPNNPNGFTDYIMKSISLPSISQNEPYRITTLTMEDNNRVGEVLNEIMGNHEFNKLMRVALQDNPGLYDRFKMQMNNSLMPSLWTYTRPLGEPLKDAVSELPNLLPPYAAKHYAPSLQNSANRYLDDRAQWHDKMVKHLGSSSWRSDDYSRSKRARTLDATRREVDRQDPTLYSDIYNHMLQKGMPVPQNAWYNNFQPVDQPQRPIDLLMQYTPTMLKRVDENGYYDW